MITGNSALHTSAAQRNVASSVRKTSPSGCRPQLRGQRMRESNRARQEARNRAAQFAKFVAIASHRIPTFSSALVLTGSKGIGKSYYESFERFRAQSQS